jgi:hypothetical protein
MFFYYRLWELVYMSVCRTNVRGFSYIPLINQCSHFYTLTLSFHSEIQFNRTLDMTELKQPDC